MPDSVSAAKQEKRPRWARPLFPSLFYQIPSSVSSSLRNSSEMHQMAASPTNV